ncbi:MAG: GNAT family N-acetyltransferase [Bacilli bacterium]|nr:GNAT family N-acetyltransferase [Bacilli bacterium]
MEIINIKENSKYLEEYCRLCSLEWGSNKTAKELEKYVNNKMKKIFEEDKVISILGLVDNDLIGFISLFKYDGDFRRDLTPWYATMYVKKDYRGKGYSKVLNNALLEEAKRIGYKRVYLKTDLNNYYEKFGAIYVETLNNNEKLYYMNCSTD